MKVFAISDIHVDFEENLRWVNNLSCFDYLSDLLILAGDVTDILPLFEETLKSLRKRFLEVLFIPGNHDLWISGSNIKSSLAKLQLIKLKPLQLIVVFGWNHSISLLYQ